MEHRTGADLFHISLAEQPTAGGGLFYLHDGREADSNAFCRGSEAQLGLRLPRACGIAQVLIEWYCDASPERWHRLAASFLTTDYRTDRYTARLPDLAAGLYFYRIRLLTVTGELYVGYGADGQLVLSQTAESLQLLQFSVTEPVYPTAERYLGGVIYHIFVDRFARGGEVPQRADAVMLSDWDEGIPEYPPYPGAPLKNNTFFGGTLWGIVQRLDHIQSLGVTLIYLSPIFEAFSNHKYDTGDYMVVDAMFGGREALLTLIREAGARGIGIILDGVFNHTGDDSRYFNRYGRYGKEGAYQSPQSPYYSWYEFRHFPDSYACWWDIPILPRLRPQESSCGDFIAGEGGVVDTYARMGIAGFRLDVADELSDAFLSRIRSTLSAADPSTLLLGEVWEDASNKIAYGTRKQYYLGHELDGVMNYPIRTGLLDFLRDGRIAALREALTRVLPNAPSHVQHRLMNLLGTHDTERVLTLLAGDSGEGVPNDVLATRRMTPQQRQRGVTLLKLAYTALATLPGLPSIYYGDEAGMEGYHDPFNRRPYPWGREDQELLGHYRRLGQLRRQHAIYRQGRFRLLVLEPSLLLFARWEGEDVCLTVINRQQLPLSIQLEQPGTAWLSGQEGQTFTIAPMQGEILCTRMIAGELSLRYDSGRCGTTVTTAQEE